jgi:hypothetical protein
MYPKSENVLGECGMYTIEHFIIEQRNMIATCMVEHSIFQDCMESERRARLGTLAVVVGNWI